jgi:hypothetical protein
MNLNAYANDNAEMPRLRRMIMLMLMLMLRPFILVILMIMLPMQRIGQRRKGDM